MARQQDLNRKWSECDRQDDIKHVLFSKHSGGHVSVVMSNCNGAPARPQPQNRAWAECDRQNEMEHVLLSKHSGGHVSVA
jgi:hypothetical protein